MLVMVAPLCRRPHTIHAIHFHAGSLRQRVLQRVQELLLWPLLGPCLTASNPDSVVVAKRQDKCPINYCSLQCIFALISVSASLSSKSNNDDRIASAAPSLSLTHQRGYITHKDAVIARMTQGHAQAFNAVRLTPI